MAQSLVRSVLNTSYFVEQYNDDCFRIIELPFSNKSKKGKMKISIQDYYKDLIDRFENGEPFDDIGYYYNNLAQLQKNSIDKSVSRSKRNLRRICLSNEFEYFSTWTIDCKHCDRFHIQDVFEKMQELTKAFRRINKNFQYVYVLEKHLNGAFHLHGMIKGVKIGLDDYNLVEYKKDNYDKLPYYILDSIEKGDHIYHIPFFDNKLGYNTFTKIKDNSKSANYILKYISKDISRLVSGRVYLRSKGLSFGEHYEVADIDSRLFKKAFEVKNDSGQVICRVRDIYLNTLNKKELAMFKDIVD